MFGHTFGMVFGFAAGTVAALSSQAELLKERRLQRPRAEQIALAKVSHRVVESAEIEKEKGISCGRSISHGPARATSRESRWMRKQRKLFRPKLNRCASSQRSRYDNE